MTKSTDTKNIKQIVQGLMMKHNLVDSDGNPILVIEVDFVGAWTRYVNEREEGLTPAESREKLVREYGVLGFVGVSNKVAEKMRMTQLIMDTIHLNVDEGRSEWARVVNFCLEMESKGQTIKQYQEWREGDVFNSPKAHQIAQRPIIIKETWPQAFVEVKESPDRPEYQKFVAPPEEEFVPNPKAKK